MKKNNVTKSAVMAAFVSLIGLAQTVEARCSSFTALEALPPETRQQIGVRLTELTKNMEIDWDSVVVGLTNEGEICLRAKSEIKPPVIAGNSCDSSSSIKPSEK